MVYNYLVKSYEVNGVYRMRENLKWFAMLQDIGCAVVIISWMTVFMILMFSF